MDRLHRPANVRNDADLRILADEINAAHKAGEDATRRGLEHFREAGIRLLRAKEQVGHGKWKAWLDENIKFSRWTAAAYSSVSSQRSRSSSRGVSQQRYTDNCSRES